MMPVRCFTCGKVVQRWNDFMKLSQSQRPNEALDALGYDRYCCKRMLLTHVDLIDKKNEFKSPDSFPKLNPDEHIEPADDGKLEEGFPF
jgi:DNA-directed RNA polymerase subunit N (RpoN/RPB10)